MTPITRYAKSEDVHIAYQVYGDGPVNLVVVPPFVSHIDNYWDNPDCARWLESLGRFARVAIFDKRGTGMSDRLSELPSLEQRMDDVRAIMDAAGIEQAAMLGISEGGPLASFFAATHPDRCRGLVLYGSFAQFSSWLPTKEALTAFLGYIDHEWGSGKSLGLFAPSLQGDLVFQRWWGKFERLGASPSAAIALMKMNSQIDISDTVASISVPTLVLHRTGDTTISVEGGRFLARAIPNARLVELPGIDHLPFVGDNANRITELIEEFLTGSVNPLGVDRILATVLFVDIVGSTELAIGLGDRRWADLLSGFYRTAREEVARFRGREVDTAGDGFFASFDGPARGIRCAHHLGNALRQLGIHARIGLHTGECEVIGEKIGGIAVHIGARIAGSASADEILVSATVKDLVAGSGIEFEDRGTHTLKGIPNEWRLFAVSRVN
jgi:pimeloyl-ACP methyl ester carboxylesterase